MKAFITLLIATAALSGLAWQAAEAREYVVKNIGKAGLRASCGRGGGEFVETEGGYHCTYGNGNIRECSKSAKTCVMVTPLSVVGAGENNPGALSQFTTADAGSVD